jgi:hypothetical protein
MSDPDDSFEVTPAGAAWQVSDEGEEQPPAQPVSGEDVRHGQIEDPNLGDIPVDRQLDPHADEPSA